LKLYYEKYVYSFDNLFYDFECERVYLLHWGYKRESGEMCGFDFSGNELFTYQIEKENENGVHIPRFLGHISGSVFLVAWTDLEMGICNFTNYGMDTLNTFEIPSPVKYDLIRCFDKRYLCIQTEKWYLDVLNSVQLFDISTGKLVYKFETDYQVKFFNFNWNLQELSVVIGEDLYPGYRPDYFPKILKTGLFRNSETNLKQWARLACLKHFDDKYLAGNLPHCLKEYLGIL